MGLFVFRPCRTQSGYEALPRDPLGLDLEECAPVLEQRGFEVLNAKVMLVIGPGGRRELPTEVHLYQSGRMLIKTDAPPVAQTAASVVCESLGIDPAA